MASTPPKPSKQLGDFLQEQQEPFILEVYLVEKGCTRKSFSSEGNFSCSHGSSTKFLKRSASCGVSNRRKGFLRCPKILKAVYEKLVSVKEDQGLKSSGKRNEEFGVKAMNGDGEEVARSDRFSADSSPTVFYSCSESDKEEVSTSKRKDQTFNTEIVPAMKVRDIIEKEAATDAKLRRNGPVSVEVLPSHKALKQDSATKGQEKTGRDSTTCSRKLSEESFSSASPSSTGVRVKKELGEPLPSPRFLKSKRVLQKTDQLLFDCVRELVESHATTERGQQHCRRFLGPEELGKLVCERVRSWGKQAGDVTNRHYFPDLVEEWEAFEPQKREIEFDIAETILEEIENEIITEMVDFFRHQLYSELIYTEIVDFVRN